MKNRLIWLTGLILILIMVLSGCYNSKQRANNAADNSRDASYPLTVQDDRGRQVAVNSAPQRLVSLTPSNTEILFALGLGERIVGVTTYCDYPPEAEDKPKIGGFSDPSLEKIVAAQPDLVVAGDINSQVVEGLEEMNIKVLVYQPKSMDGVLAEINAVGRACGVKERASALAAGLQDRIQRIKEKVADIPAAQRPLVYYEVWYEPLTTVGPHTLIADLIAAAGGRNFLTQGSVEYPIISQELIIDQNPDIMVNSYGMGMDNTPDIEQIMKRKGWQDLNFVKNKRIIGIDSDLITRSGPRTVDALEQLARGFYPDRFK